MFNDIIKYEELHEASPEFFQFGNVTFLRKFGPFEQGSLWNSVAFNLEKGECNGYDENGVSILWCSFKLEAY